MNKQSIYEIVNIAIGNALIEDREPKLLTFSPTGLTRMRHEADFRPHPSQDAQTCCGVRWEERPDQAEDVKLWCEGEEQDPLIEKAIFRCMHDVLGLAVEGIAKFEPNERFTSVKSRMRHTSRPLYIGGRSFTLTLSET